MTQYLSNQRRFVLRNKVSIQEQRGLLVHKQERQSRDFFVAVSATWNGVLPLIYCPAPFQSPSLATLKPIPPDLALCSRLSQWWHFICRLQPSVLEAFFAKVFIYPIMIKKDNVPPTFYRVLERVDQGFRKCVIF